MKLAVIGSRSLNKEEHRLIVYRSINDLAFERDVEISEIVSGGAKGVDSFAESYANARRISCKIFEAEWEKYGKSAGFKRNGQIALYADAILAIWDGKSKGTMHTVRLAEQFRKPVKIIKVLLEEKEHA